MTFRVVSWASSAIVRPVILESIFATVLFSLHRVCAVILKDAHLERKVDMIDELKMQSQRPLGEASAIQCFNVESNGEANVFTGVFTASWTLLLMCLPPQQPGGLRTAHQSANSGAGIYFLHFFMKKVATR